MKPELMSIRTLLKPRQNNFIRLLLDQTSLTLKGMEPLMFWACAITF
jgi:hypothetical protein